MSRALVVDADGAVELEQRPELVATAGETLVAPSLVGLCGTDLEIIDRAIDPVYVNYPLVLGHEWAGVVLDSPDGRFAAGDRVVVEGIVPCRVCAHCVEGDTNLCETYDELGFTRDGAASDRIAVRSDLVHLLAPGVDPEHGVLVEPTSVVYRALERSVRRPGLRCLVVGDGTVALLAVHLLQLWSPATTVVLGLRPEQAALASSAGADEFVASLDAEQFDLVVEAAGAPAAVSAALRATVRGGTLVLLGLPPHGSRVEIEPADLVNNDLSVLASFGYTSAAWRRVVALVNAGRIRPGLLVTHRYRLEDYATALEVLRRPPAGEARGKVVLQVG